MRHWILATAAVATLAGLAAPSADAKTYRFALVPKSLNNPYFNLAQQGCMEEAQKLGDVQCVYTGPVNQDAAAEVQTVEDLVTRGIDGIAISVADANSMTRAINRARAAGIPVITFDADAPNSKRQAYVGTDNKALGEALGKQLIAAHATPGKYAVISGGPAAENLAQRVDGANEVLKAAGWTEVAGSPTFCNDDSALGLQQAADLITGHPDLSAIVMVGGWPLFAEGGFNGFYNRHKEAIDSGKLTIVSADTLPAELNELKAGEVAALIGQQPKQMGADAMSILLALKQGKQVPTINYVGLDTVTKANVDQYAK